MNTMYGKTITVALFTLLTLTTASALQVEPGQANYSIQPGDVIQPEMEITQADGNVSVISTSRSTSNINIAPSFFDNDFDQGDQPQFQISAESELSTGNYTASVIFEDEYTDNQTNITQTNQTEQGFNLIYTLPYTEAFSNSVDNGETISFPNFDYTVNQITQDSVEFSTSSNNPPLTINTSSTETFTSNGIDYKVTVDDVYPDRNFIDITVESTDDPVVEIAEAKQGGKITIKESFPSTPIVRGESFEFQTIDNVTGERIGNVKVRFRGDNYGTIERPTTGDFGYGTIKIPERFESTKIRYQVLAATSDKDYELGSGIFNIPTSYESYLQNNNLTFSDMPDEVFVGDSLSGTLLSESGQVLSDTQAIINLPNGQITRSVNGDGEFSYTVGQSQVSGTTNITVEGVRQDQESGGFNAKPQTVTIIADSDDDGVLDKNDNCPNEIGIEANNGCPAIEINLELTDGGDGVDTYRPKTQYQFEVINQSSNDTLEINANLEVENSTGGITDFDVEQGTANVGFSDAGDYELIFDENKTQSEELSVTVEAEDSFPLGTMLLVILIVLAAVFVVYLVTQTDLLSGSSGNNSDVGVGGSMAGNPRNREQDRGRGRGGQ